MADSARLIPSRAARACPQIGLQRLVLIISHRSFGFHGPEPLIALIYLSAGGIVVDPPFTTNS